MMKSIFGVLMLISLQCLAGTNSCANKASEGIQASPDRKDLLPGSHSPVNTPAINAQGHTDQAQIQEKK